MKHTRSLVLGLLASACLPGLLLAGTAEEDAPKLLVLTQVASRASIVKGGESVPESKQTAEWVKALIAAKEKRADREFEEFSKKELEQLEAKRASNPRNKLEGTLRVVFDFYVPEVDTYEAIVEIFRAHKALADDAVEALTGLDRDRNGKLSAEEYTEAAAIVNATKRIFDPLDANNDGLITETEINAAWNVPRDAAAAIKPGKGRSASAAASMIKDFDANSDGALDVDERKALTMKYVEFSMRFGKDAAFYKQIRDSLAAARDEAGEKFSNREIKR